MEYNLKHTTYKPYEIPRLNRPIVYGWRRNDQYLYIGKSRRGTERIVNGNVLRFHTEPDDVVDIWKVTLQNVDSVEIHLIRRFNPKHNVVYANNPCSFDSDGNQICTHCKIQIKSRSNQRFCTRACRVKHWKQQETRPGKMREYKKLLKELDKKYLNR